MPDNLPGQLPIRCTIMRAGTSKGLYFHEEDLPAAGPSRDAVLRRLMGSPDPLQIDGLGGSRLITSKIAIITRSEHPDADVDYTFAQIDPSFDLVAYDANCGNISAGVGPFAVDEGLVVLSEPVTAVRIFNTNTKKILVAYVPVRGSKAETEGDFSIPGVPGTGAEVFMDYAGTVGAKTGRMLPTGRVVDELEIRGYGRIKVTLCDVGNPVVFVRAEDIGLTATERPSDVDADAAVIETLRELRGKAAELIGFCSDWRDVDNESANLPVVMFVGRPQDCTTVDHRFLTADAMDVVARFVFFNRCHESMAGTGSVCIAAASRIEGSVVHQVLAAGAPQSGVLRIAHPMGIMTVQVRACGNPSQPVFERLGFGRTARRIMDGLAYFPQEVLEVQA